MKRFAYSLIGLALLWVIASASLGENIIHQRLEDIEHPAPPPEPTEMILMLGMIGAPVLCAIAGWILSGTSDPPEGIGHRMMMTFVGGLAGFLATGGLAFSIYGFRSWLWPPPQQPEKD